MKIKKLAVGALMANCYIVWDESSMEGVVIDPGYSGEYISEEIMREKVKLVAILLTHGHFDHVQASLELKLNFSVPVMLNQADEQIYTKSGKSMEYWTDLKAAPVPFVDRGLKEGDEIKFGGEVLEVLETPGHTPGSVCLYNSRTKVLFSGDTLFKNGVGRTDFKYSDSELMKKSLQRLMGLPNKTMILSGHGDETSIDVEALNLANG